MHVNNLKYLRQDIINIETTADLVILSTDKDSDVFSTAIHITEGFDEKSQRNVKMIKKENKLNNEYDSKEEHTIDRLTELKRLINL